jgi:hypothetical protein
MPMGLPQEVEKKTRSIPGRMESQVKTAKKNRSVRHMTKKNIEEIIRDYENDDPDPWDLFPTNEEKIVMVLRELPFVSGAYTSEKYDHYYDYQPEYEECEDYDDFEQESRECDAYMEWLEYHEHDVDPLPRRAFYRY